MKNKFFLGLLLCALITPLKADDPSQNESANNKEKANEEEAAIQDTVNKLNQLTTKYQEIKQGNDENDEAKKNEIIEKAIPLLTSYDTNGKPVDGLTVLKEQDAQYTQAAKNFIQTVGGNVLNPVHKKLDELRKKIDPNSPGAKNLKTIAEDAKTESFGNSMYYHMMMQGNRKALSENDKSKLDNTKETDDEFDNTKENPAEDIRKKLPKHARYFEEGNGPNQPRNSTSSRIHDAEGFSYEKSKDKEEHVFGGESVSKRDGKNELNNFNVYQIEKDANTLGLSVRDLSDPKKVNTAYRTLSLKYHPDKGGDKEKFYSLQEAYERCKNIKLPADLFEKDHQDQNKEPLSLENESLPLKDQEDEKKEEDNPYDGVKELFNEETKPSKSTDEDESSDLKPLFEEDEKKEEDNPYDGVKELFQESIPESTKKTTAEIGVGTDGLTNTDESSVDKENQRDFIPAKKTRESQLKRRNTL